MRISGLGPGGALLIEPGVHRDERGYVLETWSSSAFAEHGIDFKPARSFVSVTRMRGSIRGMHYQRPPSREGKLIHCTRGSVVDVLVDIRPDSATFLEHRAVELNAANPRAVYLPPGFAHGFQALTDDVELLYLLSDEYRPELAGGCRHDDPRLGIRWPLDVTTINERDRGYPDLGADDFACFGGL